MGVPTGGQTSVNRGQIGAMVIMFGGVAMVGGGILALRGPAAESESAVGASGSTSTTSQTQTTTDAPPTPTSSITAAPAPMSTSTSTIAPTSTSTTIPTEMPEEFLTLLVEGLRGDPDLLVSRLNQVTLDIYGEEQCRETLSQTLDPETELEIREIGETGPWDYVIDDITTPLDGVLALEVQRFVAGQTIIQELHWQLVGLQWTWFSDCGEPLSG